MLKEWGVGDSDAIETEQLRGEIILRNQGEWIKSFIGEIPDVIWSLAKSCFPGFDEDLTMWFRSPQPSYGDQVPFGMLREDDGVELFHDLTETWLQNHK